MKCKQQGYLRKVGSISATLIFCILLVPFVCLSSRALASPSIEWSGPQDITLSFGPGLLYWEMDVNNDALVDFAFQLSMDSDLFLHPASANRVTDPLIYGSTTDSTSAWNTGTELMASWRVLLGGDTGCAGPWCGISNGYMGLEFDIGGFTHYGWARITVESDYESATVHDWAYETLPGVGLNAGVIPEPSTIILLSFGAFIAFLGWSRKHT